MKILLIDDHPLFCEGLKSILAQLDPSAQIVVMGSCEEAFDIIARDDDMDLVLLDINLPGINGLDGLREIRHGLPATPLIVISAEEDRDYVLRAIEAGAKGFIPKSSNADIIINAIRLVLSGGVYLPMAAIDDTRKISEAPRSSNEQTLTPRQLAVLALLADGHSNKNIARELDLAENTVRVHVSAILRYLNVSNRTEAGVAAIRLGLLS